jgi:hypothetical protein
MHAITFLILILMPTSQTSQLTAAVTFLTFLHCVQETPSFNPGQNTDCPPRIMWKAVRVWTQEVQLYKMWQARLLNSSNKLYRISLLSGLLLFPSKHSTILLKLGHACFSRLFREFSKKLVVTHDFMYQDKYSSQTARPWKWRHYDT